MCIYLFLFISLLTIIAFIVVATVTIKFGVYDLIKEICREIESMSENRASGDLAANEGKQRRV